MAEYSLRSWIVVVSCATVVTSAQASEMTSQPSPPIAAKKPYQVSSPNGAREDDYYWLRDDTRQSKEVLDYLTAENNYRDAMMASTRALEEKLYDELIGRL